MIDAAAEAAVTPTANYQVALLNTVKAEEGEKV